MSRPPPSPALLAAGASLLLALACDGTEGTLVVRGGELAGEGGGGSGGGARAGGGGGGGGGGTATARAPAPGLTWQAQLSGSVDPALDVDLFYLDPDFASPEVVAEIRRSGRLVLCYVSAGTFEPWRDDANEFPEAVLGEPLADYPREQWLDVRDERVRTLMRARFDGMAAAGCDGVYPSSLEGHLEQSGLDLTRADVAAYATWLAAELHARGMSAGLSVPGDLVAEVEPDYDWALAIDCLSDSGCAPWVPVRQSGRAVLLVEYGDEESAPAVCQAANGLGFDALVKRPAFDGFRIACDGVAP